MTVFGTLHHSSESMDAGALEELASYRESLRDLTQNSKPHINMLTMLAEENFHQGSAVVSAIEDHILQVPPKLKLPALYLIDSIVKNVTEGDFKPLFRPRLIAIVSHIFKQTTDEAVRRAIFKLRETWIGVFEDVLLAQLDRVLQAIDPKWPVAPTPSVVVHSGTATSVPMAHPLQMSVNAPPPKKPSPPTTPPEATERPVSEEAKNVIVPAKRQEILAKNSIRPKGPIVRNSGRTEIPSVVRGISVAMESLEPPAVKSGILEKKPNLPRPAIVNRAAVPMKARPLKSAVPSALKSDTFLVQEKHAPLPNEPKSVPSTKLDRSSPIKEANLIRKAMPRIPRKERMEVAPLIPSGPSLQAPSRKRPLQAESLHPSSPSPQIIRKRLPMARIPKRSLDHAESGEDAKRKKISDRPENREAVRSSSPPRSAHRGARSAVHRGGPARPSFPRYPAPVRRMEQQSEQLPQVRQHYPPRHQPYPMRGPNREPARWMAPQPDYHEPRYAPPPPMDEHYLDRVPMRAPLIATPPLDDRAVFELQMQDGREKVRTGEFNAVQYQQFEERAHRDFELQQLRTAVRLSMSPVQRDFTGLRDGGPVNFVSIDEVEHEVRWVQNKPVVIKDGLILDIGFTGPPVVVYIDHIATALPMTESRDVFFGSRFHKIKFGGPNFELIVDEVTPFRVGFDSPDVTLVTIDGRQHKLRLGGPAPLVEIGSVPLNDQIFGHPAAGDGKRNPSDSVSNEELLSRIIASPAFALLTQAQTVPAEPVVAPPVPVFVETVMPTDVTKLTELRLTGSPRTYSDARTMLRTCIQSSDTSAKLLDGPVNLRNFMAAIKNDLVENRVYFGFLEKLHLDADFPCRLCEERFLPSEMEARKRNVVLHNGFTRMMRDNLHIADWMLGSSEFVEEKSFECDTSCDDLNKMFSDYAAKRGVRKSDETASNDISGTDDSLSSRNRENSEFIVQECPIVESSQKNFCFICKEEILVEENEDDDWVLKDGLRVTTKADETIKIYHRDCFDQNVQKSADEEPSVVLSKPSRWGSATIDTPVLLSKTAPSVRAGVARRPSDSPIHPLIDPSLRPAFTNSTSDEVVVASSSNTTSDQDSNFVISIGDDDDEDEDDDQMLVNITMDETDE